MAEDYEGPERRATPESPLVTQLRRVSTGMEFRHWTRKRIAALAALLAFDILATVTSVAAIVRVNEQGHHIRAESIARARAICATANENRRAINADKAKLVKVFTIAQGEQPAGTQQPSRAVLDAYADYTRPVQLIDCPRLVAGQLTPLPLLAPGVDPGPGR